jgi:type IV secretory pathway VirB10-like protein
MIMKWKIVLAVLCCTVLLAKSAHAQDEDPGVNDETVKSDVANIEDYDYNFEGEISVPIEPVAEEMAGEEPTVEEQAVDEPAEQVDAVALDQNEDTVDVESDVAEPANAKSARRGKYSAYDDYMWSGIDDASDMNYNWNGESVRLDDDRVCIKHSN